MSGILTVNAQVVTGTITIPVDTSTPSYSGDYVITPKAFESTTLYTKGKKMLDDVLVQKVPYYETSNIYNGYTVFLLVILMLKNKMVLINMDVILKALKPMVLVIVVLIVKLLEVVEHIVVLQENMEHIVVLFRVMEVIRIRIEQIASIQVVHVRM